MGSAVSCVVCGGHTQGRRRYCSDACKWKARPRKPCVMCGGPTGWAIQAQVADPICHPCRRKKPTYREPRMAARGFVEKWSCAGCGAECERPAVRGQRPKWCDDCRALGRDWVPAHIRRSIYERDRWSCQICLEPVSSDLIGTASHWRPSLDHITPRSRGGLDVESNLRLAHWWCNVARNDERAYTDADFRAV